MNILEFNEQCKPTTSMKILTDKQLQTIAYSVVRELQHRNDFNFDSTENDVEKVFYYGQRIARYLLFPDISSPEELEEVIEDYCKDGDDISGNFNVDEDDEFDKEDITNKLLKAMTIIDTIYNM